MMWAKNTSASGSQHPTQEYYPALDGLRAISVLLVIVEHVRLRSSLLGHLQGWLGVDIFLVLSGFLITSLLLREEAETGRIALLAFYGRRIFRIVPAYALMLAIYCVLCHSNPAKWTQLKDALPYYLTFTNEFVKFGAPFGATWTIAVEEKFYLLWPLLFFVVCRSGWRNYSIPVLIAASFLLPFRMAHSSFSLVAGCALALILTHPSAAAWRAAIARIPLTVLMSGVILGFVIVDRNWNLVPFFTLAVSLLVGNLILRKSWLSATLESRALVWMGRRSYSIYLVHGLALDAVQRAIYPSTVWRQLAVATLASIVAAAAANLMYRTVEEPMRRYGRSWTSSWSRPARRTPALPPLSTADRLELGEFGQPEIVQ